VKRENGTGSREHFVLFWRLTIVSEEKAMIPKNTRRRGGWAAALVVLVLGSALAAPPAAFAGDKKGKDGKIPIVIGPITKTPDPPPPPKK
jgi:hypothetical protein